LQRLALSEAEDLNENERMERESLCDQITYIKKYAMVRLPNYAAIVMED
jgi:hypothetical protein